MTEEPQQTQVQRLRRGFDRFADSYGLVLVLIAVTMLLGGIFGGRLYGRPITVFLLSITLLVGLSAARVRFGTFKIAGAISTVMLIVSVLSAVTAQNGLGALATTVMAGVLIVMLPAVVVRGIMEQTEINLRTIAGALCVYLLVGYFFSLLYTAMAVLDGNTFFAQQVPFHPFNFIYFSFVTMTTVGYGDLTAAGDPGRMLAVLEALIGQIYLVTVIAVLVGNMGRQREARRRREGKGRRGLRRGTSAASEPAADAVVEAPRGDPQGFAAEPGVETDEAYGEA
jgi:Ion channel